MMTVMMIKKMMAAALQTFNLCVLMSNPGLVLHFKGDHGGIAVSLLGGGVFIFYLFVISASVFVR